MGTAATEESMWATADPQTHLKRRFSGGVGGEKGDHRKIKTGEGKGENRRRGTSPVEPVESGGTAWGRTSRGGGNLEGGKKR